MTERLQPGESSSDEAPYREIISAIVKRFVRLVGAPAALQIARRIPYLSVDDEGNVLAYDQADPIGSIKLLIDRYGSVFGEVAITLSRQAAQSIAGLPEGDILEEVGLLPEAEASPMKILLVDDHVLFREGLIGLLDPQPDMTVVGQASSAGEAIALTRKLEPDVIVMDISLPDADGVQTTLSILTERPAAKVVMLTVHDDDDHLFAAIRAGAMGYMSKNVRAAELLKRLRAVARGEAGISPAIARRILSEFSRTPAPQETDLFASTELTAREIEVVRELARGATNAEIARRLVISENTVKNHVRNVLSKLHLRSRRDVVDYARKHGLASQPPRPSESV